VQVAAAVTSRRHDAAEEGGDVRGTDELAMPVERAGGAAESAARWLGDPPPAGWAGGGGAALVHEANLDSGPFGLVPQGPA
jgi:hypothetical protein